MRSTSKLCSCPVVDINTSAHQHISTNQKGIALLLVIGSIVILTMLAVEFAYHSQVEYHLAVRQKERLQATYMANSAYNLIRLELKIGNSVQSQVSSAASQANVQIPVDLSAPLCQQFPMKTALFRLFATGGSQEKEEGEKKEEKATPTSKGMEALSVLPLQGVEEFLQFEGDFEGECLDEASKIDLNFFYGQDPAKKIEGGDNSYDQYKKFLIGILGAPAYQELFQKADVKVGEVVRNIADWIDVNEVINDFGGAEGGSEDSKMTTKNGKMSTPDDIYMVAGVEDSWWIPVSDLFTIYGITSPQGRPQINVCRAPNEVVRTLILRYTETRADLPPLKVEDEDILKQLVTAVKGGCTGAQPDKNKISQDLDAKLLELLKAKPATSSAAGAPGYPAQVSPFADWVATKSRFYRLKLLGQVKETVVNIQTVIDMGENPGSDVSRWKTVYYKIE